MFSPHLGRDFWQFRLPETAKLRRLFRLLGGTARPEAATAFYNALPPAAESFDLFQIHYMLKRHTNYWRP